ncbi:hypothetical protein G8O24_05310 [Bradyrhizobium sp. INPA01-394B]|uniref:Uncharacterized protein n=1 Tax=Bradyrhizobium campsiandrae TaxID=1729892 RepID=A0ABR7U5G5_9BRAD|nr:hypothetical protein [Bradyrhizobium campsiandrae]MBC9876769.1 hypothetical protein [Bradyrhizobium campsiandrae]MBC9979283.1 hypothetical protein [Bradyrhizobium campsiandrae]
MIYQNDAVSKPVESGEIEQEARDRVESVRVKRGEFCLNVNGLSGKGKNAAGRVRVCFSRALQISPRHPIITESCNV